MLKRAFFGLLCLILATCAPEAKLRETTRFKPNVLFIAVDDLNDWVGFLKGHPQVKTPHLDRLAASGMAFTNAHAQAPLCNPSRTSILTGLRPSSTGIYGLSPWFRNVDSLRHITSMPQHFSNHGYTTFSAGKVYHGGYGRQKDDYEFDSLGPGVKITQRPSKKLIGSTPGGNHGLMDWGYFDHKDADKTDYKMANWAVEVLQNEHARPFFLSVGFFLPHVPLYVTKEWWEMYPDEELQLPPIKEDDRADTPRFSWYLHWDLPEPRLKWLREAKQERNLVRSYLAAISFVDAQLGRLLQALEQSQFSENTLVVLWSDHGYHLGEKQISGKNTLWEPSTHVPLIFSGPGIPPGSSSGQPVELLDIFPTLNDLAGLPQLAHLEGESLMSLISDPTHIRKRPAITTHNWQNHSVRTERWRYIKYADGSEELYDMARDPEEYTNLATETKLKYMKDSLSQWLPKQNQLPRVQNPLRLLESHKDTIFWEGKPIFPEQAIPGL